MFLFEIAMNDIAIHIVEIQKIVDNLKVLSRHTFNPDIDAMTRELLELRWRTVQALATVESMAHGEKN